MSRKQQTQKTRITIRTQRQKQLCRFRGFIQEASTYLALLESIATVYPSKHFKRTRQELLDHLSRDDYFM